MSTASVSIPLARLERRPNRVVERAFFAGMAVLILATVLFGFAKTYFMAGMVAAPLPNKLIHIHGAAFTLWIVLLITQIALVSAKQVRVHKQLGLWGFGLAVVMVGLGLTAAVNALRRGVAVNGLDAQTFFIVPVTAIFLFAVIIGFSYRLRRNPAAHKRLVIIATIALLDAAVGRWPIHALQVHPPLQDVVLLGFLVLVAAYDLLSLHKIHRATIWASALCIVVHLVRIPIGQSAPWHALASRLGGHG